MTQTEISNGAGKETLTRLAARRLRQIADNGLSPQLRQKAQLAILDYLGAVASGLQAPWAPSVVKYAQSRRGARESHAWGLQEEVSAETAAFVNATLAHRWVSPSQRS